MLYVFPVKVFVGVPPSVLLIPTKPVAPVAVILDKLLFWKVIIDPATELAFEVKKVIVPPAPVLLNAVTIELLLIVCVPPEVGTAIALTIKLKLPVVLVDKLVNVLLEILVFKLAIALEMAVIVALVANDAVKAVKLLPFIFCVEVAVPVVLSTVIP